MTSLTSRSPRKAQSSTYPSRFLKRVHCSRLPLLIMVSKTHGSCKERFKREARSKCLESTTPQVGSGSKTRRPTPTLTRRPEQWAAHSKSPDKTTKKGFRVYATLNRMKNQSGNQSWRKVSNSLSKEIS